MTDVERLRIVRAVLDACPELDGAISVTVHRGWGNIVNVDIDDLHAHGAPPQIDQRTKRAIRDAVVEALPDERCTVQFASG